MNRWNTAALLAVSVAACAGVSLRGEIRIRLYNDFGRAAGEGRRAAISAYLFMGLDPNKWVTGATPPLMMAALVGDPDMIHYLVDRGADVHLRGKTSASALDLAVQSRHLSAVEALIELGASVNEEGEAGLPLDVAAKGCDVPMFKLLRSNGGRIVGLPTGTCPQIREIVDA